MGSLRREYPDHVIVLGERVQPPTEENVAAFSEVGGLHHRYERRAA
jgi:hypothetical protein